MSSIVVLFQNNASIICGAQSKHNTSVHRTFATLRPGDLGVMEERVFFEGDGSSVTSTKIVINGNTYATRNVGSVRIETKPASRGLGIVLALVGLFALFSTAPVFGLMMLAAGVIIAMVAKSRAKLLLMAGGGESVAIESPNVKFVNNLHAAIVEAISVR